MNTAQSLLLAGLLGAGSAIGISAPPDAAELAHRGNEIPLEIAKIYWEYNATANDLGVHVFLDGEDWRHIKITNPDDRLIFAVGGFGPYREFGMTELFFEGAEPALDEVPLDDLLAEFPQGEYDFEGRTVDGEEIEGEGELSHAIPDGPDVSVTMGAGDLLQIHWTAVTAPPPGFPDLPINVVAYQVIVESFQVTVPATVLSMTVPPEFVGSLASGKHQFEVLAIEESGNQTLTEGYLIL
ncbi:MAG: hypothetical protein EYC70_01405 [Planctomycetota bacterium]|nr:MAG: hypothetical protein EYC70_01405 [Planctomycetota bacterium]